MYNCPHCQEPAITFWQKAWIAYIARSVACRGCGGSVGVSTVFRYLTNAPLLLFAVGPFIYLNSLSDENLRTRQSFWIFIVSLFVVPTVYGVVMAVFRMWFPPLVHR